MSYSRPKQVIARRTASVIVCVLVVILLVGMLSMQTVQTLAVIRRGDDDRTKILQARELIEFAQAIDWNAAESKSLTIQIPDSVRQVGESEALTAILERQTIAANSDVARIIVRFPADKPGEVTTTEPDHE